MHDRGALGALYFGGPPFLSLCTRLCGHVWPCAPNQKLCPPSPSHDSSQWKNTINLLVVLSTQLRQSTIPVYVCYISIAGQGVGLWPQTGDT
jgi:hypothetical protein